MKYLLPLLAAAVAAPALAAPPVPQRAEASIPFVTQPRAIRSFNAPSDGLLFVQDRHSRWYRAR